MLVRPDVARRQIDQETIPPAPTVAGQGQVKPSEETKPITHPDVPGQSQKPRRYHGTVILDSARVRRIEAEIPEGAPDNVVRTVTENSRTLKFESNSGFETE